MLDTVAHPGPAAHAKAQLAQAKAGAALRCRRCKSVLTFAGISKHRQRVYACTATLHHTEKGRNIAVACSPLDEFVNELGEKIPGIDGKNGWLPRPKEKRERRG